MSFYIYVGTVSLENSDIQQDFSISEILITVGNSCLKTLVSMSSEISNKCYHLHAHTMESGCEFSQRPPPVIFLPLHTACLLCLRWGKKKEGGGMLGWPQWNSLEQQQGVLAVPTNQPNTTLFSRPPANSKCLGFGSGILDCPLAKNSSSIQA